jgi:Copper type II ascorbate-dependent monooxygenase, C-terminal domain
MRFYLGLFFLGSSCIGLAQVQAPTYHQHIEPIVLKNCAPCHKPGGIGPFGLQTFAEVKGKGSFIAHVTKIKYMPPWHADAAFQTFRNEKILKAEEIELIQQWVAAGMPKGKKNKQKIIPTELKESSVEPDLVLPMLSSYQIADKGVEDFRFFVIPSTLATDTYISAVEFVPGNKKQVHHSRIMVDSTRRIRGIDGMSEMDPNVKEFQTTPLVDEFLYGWVPGNNKIFFPPGSGKLLYKGSDLILNIHYSPSAKLQEDKSVIKLYFAKTKVDRQVHTLTLRESDILNQPFFIEAERKPTFRMSYPIRKDISLISVMPHAHFIGKSFLAYVITEEDEKIPLIKIDNWDFNWQTTYQFKKLLKIPAGSRIIVEAKYDNSTENPANPNSPAKDIGYGWNSTDEMCNLVIYYLDYREGDEEIEY